MMAFSRELPVNISYLVMKENKIEQIIERIVEQKSYNIDFFIDNILLEILIRLPTSQSAHQCKCVCKRWLSIISSPYFVSRFNDHHEDVSNRHSVSKRFTLLHQYRFFAYHDIEPDPKLTITTHPVHTKIEAITDQAVLKSRRSFELDCVPFCLTADIVASCDDLLICYDRWISFELLQQGKGATFYMCNALTKECLALPPAPSSYWRSGLFGFIKYAAEPRRFELSGSMYNYKLVHIPKDRELCAEIFSSETGEWRKSTGALLWRFDLQEKSVSNAVTFNRKLHWIINKNNILAFDPFDSDEKCRLISLPILQVDGQTNEMDCLGVFQGILQLSQLVHVDRSYRVIVWYLTDYNTGEWCLKHNVSLNVMEFVGNHASEQQLEFGDGPYLLASHPFEEAVVYLRYKNHIIICNVQEETLEAISECSKSWNWHLRNERDAAFPLVHPCWPTPIHP